MSVHMSDGAVDWFDAAIRADERAKCRAELREKIEEYESQSWWMFDDIEIWRHFRDWARGTEAFKGE
jgi:hypothetical protein